MKKFRFLIICVIFVALLALSNLTMAVTPVHASGVNLLLTPTPTVTVTVTPTPPTGGGNTTTTTLSQIFNHLVFPAETISEALANIFNKAADKEVRAMSEEVARWTSVIGEIVQAPSQGDYTKVAQSSLPVAAGWTPSRWVRRSKICIHPMSGCSCRRLQALGSS